MSEAANAAAPHAPNPQAQDASQNRVVELRVSGHMMTLETGVFCIFPSPGSPAPDPSTGLPGVRLSVPPGPAGRPEATTISTFRTDGWVDGAALVRVSQGPAQIMVTIYQAPNATEGAPRLQVTKLSGDGQAGPVAAGAVAPAAVASGEPEVVAHVQRSGDLGARIGDWIGQRGSRLWIEGFGIAPHDGINPEDIEYQAVLGRGWLSPWVEGGKFCGSRGMALPLLGITVRLKGAAARNWDLSYSGTFTDGSEVGPVEGGETCEAESLAALEAFQIVLKRRTTRAAEKPAEKPAAPPRPTGRAARPVGRKTGAR